MSILYYSEAFQQSAYSTCFAKRLRNISFFGINVTLITLAHPLVKQAALMLASQNKTVTFFKVSSNIIEKGEYPFIMYQWMYSGDHEDVNIL